MSRFRCLIQAESPADASRGEIETRLAAHHDRHHPGERIEVAWVPIPHGHMFTEGEHSTSSIVSCFVDHPTTLDTRERYMRGVCDIWTEVTRCTDHEVVVTMTETELATQE